MQSSHLVSSLWVYWHGMMVSKEGISSFTSFSKAHKVSNSLRFRATPTLDGFSSSSSEAYHFLKSTHRYPLSTEINLSFPKWSRNFPSLALTKYRVIASDRFYIVTEIFPLLRFHTYDPRSLLIITYFYYTWESCWMISNFFSSIMKSASSFSFSNIRVVMVSNNKIYIL